MTVLAQTLEKLKLWAATGFQEDKDFACRRENSTWDGDEFSKLADANCDSIIEQHSQLRAMDADNVQSLVAEFFDQASHLPPDDLSGSWIVCAMSSWTALAIRKKEYP